jgi:hypothetical protein
MSKKVIQATLNEDEQKLLQRLCKEEFLTDNVSHVIRYAIKYLAKDKLKGK